MHKTSFKFLLPTAALLSIFGCGESKPNASSVLAESFLDLFADEDAVRPTPEHRNQLVNQAITFTAEPRDDRSILQGPKQFDYEDGGKDRIKYREFAHNQAIECTYRYPWEDDRPGGKTPKFYCDYQYTNGSGQVKSKKLKVKYDDPSFSSINTGVYGEVLATRLLWALGYPADSVLAVQVKCNGCPSNPWGHLSDYWSIFDLENDIATASSSRRKELEKRLLKDSIMYIKEHLTRYDLYTGVKYLRQGDSYIIENAQGQVIFNSADGILHLGEGRSAQVFDPQSKRLVKTTIENRQDLLINHLDASLWGETKPAVVAYTSAVVEWKHASIPVETYHHEGWNFNENPRNPGRGIDIRNVDASQKDLVIQRQELALLATFIVHADNKAEQQRLICLDIDKIEAEGKDCQDDGDPRSKGCQEGTDTKFETCEKTAMMMQDVGFAFGYGAKVVGTDNRGRPQFDSTLEGKSYGTADAQGFIDAPLFKDEARCITTINEWATGVEIEEAISEEARVSLVTKLKALVANDQDLTDLFKTARLHLKELHLKGQAFPKWGDAPLSADYVGGELENGIVDNWKKVFAAKVEKLANTTCPTL